MKTISIQELPAPVSEWLQSMEASEGIAVTGHGKILEIVIRSLPAPPPEPPRLPDGRIDWSTSYAFRDRTGERVLTAEEIAAVLEENKGDW